MLKQYIPKKKSKFKTSPKINNTNRYQNPHLIPQSVTVE